MAGRYKILDHLAAGGVGEVYKAYDTQLDRYVAIKRLLSREESEQSDGMSSTLRKEAASLATLQHPNIVSVFDLASDEVGLFIVMELLEGDTLADWLKGGPMGLNDFKEFASQTLEGILSAHQVNILHRDLKPENIKMNRLPGGRLQAKIVDFGLARMSYAARKQTEDQSGNVLGSIFYMAPEQFLRRSLDGRTDLYSLGCVYYQCLSGHRPYNGPTVKEVMDAHLQHQVHDLKVLCPDLPAPVCDWVMWMINLEQIHRPQNARAALDHLRALVDAGWFAVAMEEPAPEPQPVVEVVQKPVARITGQQPPRPGSSPVRPQSGAVRPPSGAVRPPSGAVRPPTGSQPAARPATAATQRPASGLVRPVGSASGMLQQAKAVVAEAVPVAEMDTEVATPKSKRAWVYGAIGAVVVVGGLLALFSGPKSKEGQADKGPGHPVLPRKEDLILSYMTSSGVLSQVGNGKDKPDKAAELGDLVVRWKDLSKNAGEGPLGVPNDKREFAPTLRYDKFEQMKMPLNLLRFDGNQVLLHHLDKTRGEAKQYPFSESTTDRGMTVFLVVRMETIDQSVTCFRGYSDDGKTSVMIRCNPGKRDFRCIAKVEDKMKESHFNNINCTKGFAVLSATFNMITGKIYFAARAPDGNRARNETDMPEKDVKKYQVINNFKIGEDPKNHPPDDCFKGDIVELQIYNSPMTAEERSLGEQKLSEYYIANPGPRYQ